MKKHWIKGRIQSFKFAFQGIFNLFRAEPNAQIHLFAAVLALMLGLVLKISILEWGVIIICIFSVFAFEAVNTAIETLTDLVSPDRHPLAGRAKDLAAAAVLLAAIGAACCGLLIFLPKILDLLFRP